MNHFPSRGAVPAACLAAALLATACTSRPQPPRNDAGQSERPSVQGGMIARPVALLFASMDVDHDHVIDEAELANGITREWQAIGEKTVSALALAEWSVYALGDADALPNHIAFDRNFDGQVTEVEFHARLISEFAQLDKDHDQQLTRAELLIKAPARSQSRGASNDSEGGQRRGGGGRPPR
ncbi:MAG: hypothetical protein RH945_11780 [Hyphomonas sp.]|tara:strand:+ start:5208 stop:5753 length:546 start_codon:yes stop_codon:yes gene_type:complete